MFRILAKELSDEMVVLSDEAFFYDPGSTVKKPSVTVADTNTVGEVISTANDYTVAYEDATAAGAIPVTVTAKNNYYVDPETTNEGTDVGGLFGETYVNPTCRIYGFNLNIKF